MGWTNLSLFSFATYIHCSIHASIAAKKMYLKEAKVGEREEGKSRRRKYHGESFVRR